MSEVVHADIFFFITAVAVVLVAGGMLVALYHIIYILRDVREIVAKLNRASSELEQDFETLRSTVKEEGTKVRTIVDMALAFVVARMKKPAIKIVRRKPKPKTPPPENETLQ